MKNTRLSCAFAITGTILLALTMRTYAQKELPAVTVTAENYKYLNAVNPEEAPEPVNMVQQYAAAYDVKSAPFYDDEFANYVVSFYIPDGRILARYDSSGALLQTAERYENVRLPKSVSTAVAKKYPGWVTLKDVYLVSYYNKSEVSSKVYKIVLEKSGKRLRIKINDQGEFL